MLKKFIDNLVLYIPYKLAENPFFAKIVDILKSELPDDESLSTIHLTTNETMYIDLIEMYPELLNRTEISEISGNVLKLMKFLNTGILSWRIYEKENDEYKMILSIKSVNNYNKRIEMTIKKNTTIIEVTLYKAFDQEYEDYRYEIYYYDELNQLIDIDYEKIKDINFSEEFAVPIEKARNYRTNFKKYAHELSVNRFQNIHESYDETLGLNHFLPAFKLEDLETFILKEFDKECSIKEPKNYTNKGALDQIVNSIKGVIGASDEVLISYNLYEVLNFYLFEITNKLYNKGIIIKKLKGKYTAYYIHIDDKQIFGIPKQLNEEDIRVILENNDQKEEIRSFFGLGNTLK